MPAEPKTFALGDNVVLQNPPTPETEGTGVVVGYLVKWPGKHDVVVASSDELTLVYVPGVEPISLESVLEGCTIDDIMREKFEQACVAAVKAARAQTVPAPPKADGE